MRSKLEFSLRLDYDELDDESQEDKEEESNVKDDEDFIIPMEDGLTQEEDLVPKKKAHLMRKSPMLRSSHRAQDAITNEDKKKVE